MTVIHVYDGESARARAARDDDEKKKQEFLEIYHIGIPSATSCINFLRVDLHPTYM